MLSGGLSAEQGIQTPGFLSPNAGSPSWRAFADQPEQASDARQGSASESLNDQIQKGSKSNLLLVEDNAADAMLVEEAIQLHDVPVQLHIVVDGEEAIAFIERAERDPQAPCPDMLLLDLNLPRKGGIDVLQRIRQSERCKHVPVVILTSSDSVKDRSDAARFGADRYFRKPTDYDEYMKVGQVLNEIVDELQGTK